MRNIILPGVSGADRTCALCALPALYRAIITIKAYNPELAKEIVREMDLPVCEEHADQISIQIDKRILALQGIVLL